jgi:hypothetical protein
MKNKFLVLSAMLFAFLLFTACEKENKMNGRINLSVTDSPIDTDGITGVFITVSEVHYNTGGNNWKQFDFEGPKTYNLLDLQRGESEMLGNFELETGTYTQLRFMLDAPVFSAGPKSNPGCYLEFEDGSTQNLFVPSGAQTGYKAVGAFTVPANGTVNVTADFDVRKSVVKASASGKYLLKPTIRLIVDDQAGQIAGEILNAPEGLDIIVYAYENGTYGETEANEPAQEATRFPNAVTSDKMDDNNNYLLAYLAPGMYTIVVTSVNEGEFIEIVSMIENIEVKSRETTVLPIDLEE